MRVEQVELSSWSVSPNIAAKFVLLGLSMITGAERRDHVMLETVAENILRLTGYQGPHAGEVLHPL